MAAYIQCRINTFLRAPTYVFDCAELKHMLRGGGESPKTRAGNFFWVLCLSLRSYWSLVLGRLIKDMSSSVTHFERLYTDHCL